MIFAKTILKWGGGIVVALIAAFLLVNSSPFDQAPDPEAVAAAQPAKPKYAEQENAYYAVVGFHAALGRDPHAIGRAVISEYEAALKRNPFLGGFNVDAHLGGAKVAVKGKPAELCPSGQAGCLESLMAQEARIRRLAADNRDLIERYRSLYRYRHYEEVASPGVAEPLPLIATGVVAIVQAETALKAKRRDFRGALEALERDVAFLRTVIREGRALVSKIVAASLLHRDYDLLSDLLRLEPGLASANAERLEALTRPLAREEVSLAEAFRREWAMRYRGQQMISAQFEEVWIGARLLSGFQPNATLNAGFRLPKAMAALAALPATQFPAAAGDLQAEFGPRPRPWWQYLYNRVGYGLVRVASPDYAPYIARMHDLDGHIRLVALQAEIARRKLPDTAIPRFLKEAGPRYADPYTGRPMQWDAPQRQLHFKGMGRRYGRDGVIGARLGRLSPLAR